MCIIYVGVVRVDCWLALSVDVAHCWSFAPLLIECCRMVCVVSCSLQFVCGVTITWVWCCICVVLFVAIVSGDCLLLLDVLCCCCVVLLCIGCRCCLLSLLVVGYCSLVLLVVVRC